MITTTTIQLNETSATRGSLRSNAMSLRAFKLECKGRACVESLEYFEIECVKCYCLIPNVIYNLEGKFRLDAIILEGALLMSSLFLESHHF